MAELSAPMQAALATERPLVFGAVRLALPGGTVRLLDGPGTMVIGGETYTGRDASWGVLDAVKGLADVSADQAPNVTLRMIPASTLALSAMIDPALQGSAVSILFGVADPATGLVIGTYEMLAGAIDVATVDWAANDRRVEFRITTIAERLFTIEEGRRLSDAFHQQVWPGELGLAFVTGVEDWVPWGQQLDTNQLRVRTDNASLLYGQPAGYGLGGWGSGWGAGWRYNLAGIGR